MTKEIIPAVMPRDPLDLRAKLASVQSVARYVQIDVMDGALTAKPSWPYQDDDGLWDRIVDQEEGMPFWDTINFEADLIIIDPERELDRYIAAGFQRVVFHLRSTKYPETVIRKAKKAELEVGVAVWHDDDLQKLHDIVDQGIDYVQVMGIEKVGFQGESFAEATLDIVRSLRERYPELVLQVDGGVSHESTQDLVAAGADRLVVGSAIGKTADPELAYKELVELAEEESLSTGDERLE